MIGNKPWEAWLRKYANAISPDMIRAAGRVNKPTATSEPPTSSIAPANQYSENNGGDGSGDGKPNSREVPCSRNSSAVTMRNRLNTVGEWRSSVAYIDMIP